MNWLTSIIAGRLMFCNMYGAKMKIFSYAEKENIYVMVYTGSPLSLSEPNRVKTVLI